MVELGEKILILKNTSENTLVVAKEGEGQQTADADGRLHGLPTTKPRVLHDLRDEAVDSSYYDENRKRRGSSENPKMLFRAGRVIEVVGGSS
jgi:hypothetical protein